MKTLFILNDPPYGTERTFNALRLALAMEKTGAEVTVFLMADAVGSARQGQKTPDGYYNIERMLKRVLAGQAPCSCAAPAWTRAACGKRRSIEGAHAQHDGRTRRRDRRGGQGSGVLTKEKRDDGRHAGNVGHGPLRLAGDHSHRRRHRRAGEIPSLWPEMTEREGIYLDYNASTPVAPEVRAAMRRRDGRRVRQPVERALGRRAGQARVEDARGQVAELLGCAARRDRLHQRRQRGQQPRAQGRRSSPAADQRDHIITTTVEHPAILAPCRFLERLGAGSPAAGRPARAASIPTTCAARSRRDTILVSVMHANNEVGTIQPIAEIAPRSRASTASRFHTDAAQSVGKIATQVDDARRRPAHDRRAQALRARRASARSTSGAARGSSR